MVELNGGMQQGIVYLLGAGPGDPGLITVRGRELVGMAEVLVYDCLLYTSFINTHNADLSHGFTFDMRHQLQAGPVFGPGLMKVTAYSISKSIFSLRAAETKQFCLIIHKTLSG